MEFVNAVLLIIIVVMLYSIVMKKEDYRPCSDCDYNGIPKNGMVQLNPFMWPYSAFANPDSIYLPPGTISAEKRSAPLTHLETPDHTVLTN